VPFLLPELSPSTQSFFRAAYGFLLLGSLILYLPQARRFFLSERWKGYAESSFWVDLIQNPYVLPGVGLLWFASAFGIFTGHFPVLSSLINLALCWYFFVWMRWRGVLRGAGAPGLITYWLGAAIFFTEYTSRYAPTLYSWALLVLQWDLALILFSSGYYKFRSGYLKNEGMEYGLVNPEWGYWCKLYQKLSPQHWIFKVYNQLAWSSQILAALLIFFPATRFYGGLLLIASFIVIGANIRLAFLSPMMMLCGVLFFGPGTLGDRFLSAWILAIPSPDVSVSAFQGMANHFLGIFLLGYLFFLPLAHAGLYANFYGRKTLPGIWQRILEGYTNFFGMIVWRVFTIDVVNFFIQIYRVSKENKAQRILASEWEAIGNLRYRHVAESITVTTLFTTLKYYPSNPRLFRDRLLRYSRTIPLEDGERLIFQYMSIVKRADRFEFRPVTEFLVDVEQNLVEEKVLDSEFSLASIPKVSAVREGVTPGSYQPRVP